MRRVSRRPCEDGPLLEEQETEGQRQLHSLLLQQLHTDVDIQRCVAKRQCFAPAALYRPFGQQAAGVRSLSQFQALQDGQKELDGLRELGLTDAEIQLWQSRDDPEATEKPHGVVAAPGAKQQRLQVIRDKIEARAELLSRPQRFAASRPLSRREMEIEQALFQGTDRLGFLTALYHRDAENQDSQQGASSSDPMDSLYRDVLRSDRRASPAASHLDAHRTASDQSQDSQRHSNQSQDSQRHSNQSQDSQRHGNQSQDSQRHGNQSQDSQRHGDQSQDSQRHGNQSQDSQRHGNQSQDSQRHANQSQDSQRHSNQSQGSMRDSSQSQDSQRHGNQSQRHSDQSQDSQRHGNQSQDSQRHGNQSQDSLRHGNQSQDSQRHGNQSQDSQRHSDQSQDDSQRQSEPQDGRRSSSVPSGPEVPEQQDSEDRPEPGPAAAQIHISHLIGRLSGAARPGGPLTVRGNIETLTDEEILKNRESEEEIRKIPRFRNYQPGKPSKVLCVRNLSVEASLAQLVALFSRFQQQDAPPLVYRLLTGRMKGQAFITLPDAETAQNALRLVHGYRLLGKPLVVEFGRERQEEEKQKEKEVHEEKK